MNGVAEKLFGTMRWGDEGGERVVGALGDVLLFVA